MYFEGKKIKNEKGLHFITFNVVEGIDVFTRQQYCNVIVGSLKHCIEHNMLNLHAWVIMSNHVHILASAANGKLLSEVLTAFKKCTAFKLLEVVKHDPSEIRKEWLLTIFRYKTNAARRNLSYQFWGQSPRPIELTDGYMINQKLNHIHNNPVRAGIVEFADYYNHSSAKNYVGDDGAIEIKIIGDIQ